MTETSTTTHTQWVLDDDGRRLVPRVHTREHPALLVQLELAVAGATAGATSGGFESRPAANLEPLDALLRMRREVSTWVRHGLAARPTSLAADLALLASRAHDLIRGDVGTLDGDVLRWWAGARVATTWDTAPLRPFVPCTVCDARGRLRVTVDPLAAVCLECGSAWDAATIGILGEHIRLALAEPPAWHRCDRPTPADRAREAGRLEVLWRSRRDLAECGLPGVDTRRAPDLGEVVDLRDLAATLTDLATGVATR